MWTQFPRTPCDKEKERGRVVEEGGVKQNSVCPLTFLNSPIPAAVIPEVVKLACFDRQRASANQSPRAAARDLSQARWAGLPSSRASEEEVFLVAILDVRGDCLARRIDIFLKKNSRYTERCRSTGPWRQRKGIVTRKNPGEFCVDPKVMHLCAPPSFLSLPLSPFQIVSPTSNSAAGGKLQLSTLTTDQLVVRVLA